MISYTVATNLITVTGYSSATPCNFTDLYNADKAGTLSLHARTGITAADGAAVAVDRAERPADYIVLGGASNDLYITVANWNGTTATIRITGTDRDGAAQTEDIVVNANGQYNTTKWFKTITHTQVTSATVTSFDYDLTQGQWGVIWKQGLQFRLDMHLSINGSAGSEAWFADTLKQIYLSELIGSLGSHSLGVIRSENIYSHFRLGECTDATLKTTRYGCAIKGRESGAFNWDWDIYGYNLEFYSCSIIGSSSATQRFHVNSHYSKFWHNNWSGYFYFNSANNTDVYDLVHGGVAESFSLSSITFERIYAMNMVNAVEFIGAGNISMKDVIGRENTYDVWMRGLTVVSAKAINFEMGRDDWVINWSGGSSAAILYRQYTFNLKVLDTNQNNVENATVILKDKDGTQIFSVTTNASGEITEQTVSYGYYRKVSGSTLQSYSPHTLEIRKAGYKTYKKKFTLDSKIDWTIALQRIAINIDMEVIA